MDITLYYTPQTRSIRPRWLMEELGLKYKLQNIDLHAGEGETQEYKKINPLGAVPALKIDGEVMLESGAMCHWMADYYAESKLAPAIRDAKRPMYEQWMNFSQASLEVQPWLILMHTKILPEADRVEAILPWVKQRHHKMLKVINDVLERNDYLLGDEFSAADIMVGSTLMFVPETLAKFPALNLYLERLKERSAFQRAVS